MPVAKERGWRKGRVCFKTMRVEKKLYAEAGAWKIYEVKWPKKVGTGLV
jgi:hypothetical protein